MVRNWFHTLAGLAVMAMTTAASAAEGKAVRPFNGTDLSGWKLKDSKKKSHWTVGHVALDKNNPAQFNVTPVPPGADGGPAARVMVNAKGGGVDIYTEEKFGDCTIELEFMVPKGSNSGIYVMGRYEVQVFDSFGKKKVGTGDVGALYGAAPPRVNAAKEPGQWQKFVIEFRAPRFKDGKKVANAKFVKVTLNGKVLHENVEMKGPTPSALTGKEAPTGPLMFQGDHGPVAYRNITITPRAAK